MSSIESNPASAWSLGKTLGGASSWQEAAVAAVGLLFFLAAWTVHGSIAEADKALHYDLMEAYAWGKEFQLGYNQHGPFWAWIAGAWFELFPTTNASFILLEAINCTLGVWGAWKLNGLFVKGASRHAATLLLLATPFYTFMAYKYNANTIFVSLWPWTLYFFVKSADGMRMRDALLFGLFSGFCLLSKYYAAILLLTCGLSLLFHPRGRAYLFSPLPWAAAAVCSLVVLPHVLWALNSNAPPIAYAMSLTGKAWGFALLYAGEYLRDIALNASPVPAVIAAVWLYSRHKPDLLVEAAVLSPARRRFLAVLVLAPPALTLAFGLAFRLKLVLIMSIGTFPLLPLYLMQFFRGLDSSRLFKVSAAAAIAVTVIAAAGSPFERAAMANKAGSSMVEPRRELAESVTARWHAEIGTGLRYVGGAAPYANSIAFYSADHPSSLIAVSYAKSLWVKPKDIRRHGLLIACEKNDTGCRERAASFLTANAKTTSLSIARKAATRPMPEFSFDIFIIPPEAE